MAGRKQKRSVEYFPHFVHQGKTLFTLEKMFGNDGYSTPFKILEILSDTNDHYYDFSQEEDWLYICAKLNLEEEHALKILKMMSKLSFIDQELFENKILWCQKLVDNLASVYEKRKAKLPSKPITATELPISAPEIQQSKVKESRVEESKKQSTDKSESKIAFGEEMENSSTLKINQALDDMCADLLAKKIFQKVYAFKNKMLKEGRNPRSILHTLSRCYLKGQSTGFDGLTPWGYCQQIISVEDGNYNERDHAKTS
jgi:hypothetical protein